MKIIKKRSRKNLRNLKDRLKRHETKKKSNIKNKNSNAPPLKKTKIPNTQISNSSSNIFRVKNVSKDLKDKITSESNIKNYFEFFLQLGNFFFKKVLHFRFRCSIINTLRNYSSGY